MTKRKRLLVIIVVLSLVLPTVSIVIGSAVASLRNTMQEKKEQELAVVLGEHIVSLVQNEEVLIGEFYLLEDRIGARYSALPYQDEEQEKTIQNTRFAYIYVIDENVILISRGASFQQVTGFLYVLEGDIPDRYELPDDFYYDGNRVWTKQITDHLYSFRAGV